MPEIRLSKEEARLIIWSDHDRAKLVRNQIIDHDRWSLHFELIFELDGKYYKGRYSKGATEYQDEKPFDYSESVFVEVEPYVRTMIDYKGVKND